GFKPGDVVEIDAMRFGAKKSFRVKLGEPPASEDQQVASSDRAGRGRAEPVSSDSHSYDRLGITVQPLSDEFINAQRIAVRDDAKHGLLVTSVNIRGPAYRELAGNSSDVIVRVLHPVKKEIRSPADLESVLNSLKAGDVLSVVVYNLSGSQR